ncbi:hypothetical protein IU438_24645 [Nocardia cyriacigeorgica]|nr:hypothetical protein [Nocardia cyriacigeorgica]MBF6089880.1 hypothetical protein [Nocardia cyriacigeorgica]MBF6095125.1 hypothetical protein [Nocardia cyriacigeorgica]MBF6324265.1 hypothetical protein [Nocardia cyriacigeorgica]MBF6398970.1 hypothetical protein [Nocardia cyriacigeorgica]MBF6404601.1 hypothetical protein [Nocardia cyriacigeorgica]
MTEPGRNPVRQGVAALTTIAVAVLLLVLGLLSLFEGISAVVDDELFVPGREYVYEFDTTTWGWIHIVLGGLIVLIALALFTGAVWARVIAVMLAGLSIIANFLWIPYYPWWSVLVIALNIVVIWALSTWRAGGV